MGTIINGTQKGTSLRGMTPFDILSVMASTLASWKNPQTKKQADPHLYGGQKPLQILVKFRTVIEVSDVVTRAKLGCDWFSHFCIVGSRISDWLAYSRPYNTPALPCNSVIVHVCLQWYVSSYHAILRYVNFLCTRRSIKRNHFIFDVTVAFLGGFFL